LRVENDITSTKENELEEPGVLQWCGWKIEPSLVLRDGLACYNGVGLEQDKIVKKLRTRLSVIKLYTLLLHM
jgi:hypothetical protein